MSPSFSAALEQSGYYILEAYREFIKSHTDYEQCELLAFMLFCSVKLNQDVCSLGQSIKHWIWFAASTGSKKKSSMDSHRSNAELSHLQSFIRLDNTFQAIVWHFGK